MKSGGSGCFVLINKSEDSLLTMLDNLADGWSPETDMSAHLRQLKTSSAGICTGLPAAPLWPGAKSKTAQTPYDVSSFHSMTHISQAIRLKIKKNLESAHTFRELCTFK